MTDVLTRIQSALDAAEAVLSDFTPGRIEATLKSAGDPVTEADHAIDGTLRDMLPEPGDGWLSEETADSADRLSCERVWVVDPIDGTKEFVQGIPEWCVSIGLVENGRPVAGGISSPAAGLRVVGQVGDGVSVSGANGVQHPGVLASRTEVGRGLWDHVRHLDVVPMGSVAYKLARVAAGLNAMTWTLVPKNEWDVVGGAALVIAAGGVVLDTNFQAPQFNRRNTLMQGFFGGQPGTEKHWREALANS